MLKRKINLRCFINMQSRLCSTLSNRSIDFQGRVSAYRKGKVGVSVLATVWITAHTNVQYVVTTYCCPLNEGPRRERSFWTDRKGIGTTVPSLFKIES